LLDPEYVVETIRQCLKIKKNLDESNPLVFKIQQRADEVTDEWMARVCSLDPTLPSLRQLVSAWSDATLVARVTAYIDRENPPPTLIQLTIWEIERQPAYFSHLLSINRQLCLYAVNDLFTVSEIQTLIAGVQEKPGRTEEIEQSLPHREPTYGWRQRVLGRFLDMLRHSIVGDLLDFEDCVARWEKPDPPLEAPPEEDVLDIMPDFVVKDRFGSAHTVSGSFRRFSRVLRVGTQELPPELPGVDLWTLFSINDYVQHTVCTTNVIPWVDPPFLELPFTPYEVTFIMQYSQKQLCVLYSTSVYLDIRRLSSLCCSRLCQQWFLRNSFA
jgi:hypothetical protein